MLDAHPGIGTDVRFVDATHLVSRGYAGDVLFWDLPRRTRAVAELDGLLACRSPILFDRGRGALVSHTPSCR